MAITPGPTRIDLNGATAVTVVGAPAAATIRTVLSLAITNVDSAVVTLTLQTNVSGTKKTIGTVTGLAVGVTWRPIIRDYPVFLNATTDSLEVFMSGAAATTNPHSEAGWFDKT